MMSSPACSPSHSPPLSLSPIIRFCTTACDVSFEVRDVFLPAPRHRGKYDRVHVGAACPPEKLGALLGLLSPEGGRMVVPVVPSDLRVITKAPDGRVTQRVISQVRFSELEMPGDASILLASLRAERKARTAPQELPSTYQSDLESMPSLSPRFSDEKRLKLTGTSPQSGMGGWVGRLFWCFSFCRVNKP